jgi:2-oxoisovalerate dehydrogenase E1 component
VFFFMNNFYGMGGQTIGETMAFDRLSRIGAGVRPDNLHAETIDGNNPLAVGAAMRRALTKIESGEGPVLIDCQAYRQSGHSPSDASSYRSRDELEMWRAVDPIDEYARSLEGAGFIEAGEREAVENWAKQRVKEAIVLAADTELSPPTTMRTIEQVMWADTEIDLDKTTPGRLTAPFAESPRVLQIANRARSGRVAGVKESSAQAVQLRDALFEAIAHHAVNDDRLIIYGEENRDWGGAFGVYRGLTEILPYDRLFNAPISEATIVGSAVGYAMEGGRALIELMYADFMGRAGDEIFNQLAKWRAMSGGTIELPVVLRISVGSTYGAQHSQEWTALPAHIPGLKVVFPATSFDAKGLMASALAGNDPVVFFESQSLYSQTEIFHEEGVPEEYYRIPIGEPSVVRRGADVTLLSVGATLYRAIDAAASLGEQGIAVEVIDARSLVPFNSTQVVDSVRKTGRLICVSDAAEQGNYLATLAQRISREAFDALKAPAVIVGTPNTVVPPADLTGQYFPSSKKLVETVVELVG